MPILRLTLDVAPHARRDVHTAIVAEDDGHGEGYQDERVATAARCSAERSIRYALTGTFDLDMWAVPDFSTPFFGPGDLLPRLVARGAFVDAGEPLTAHPREVGLDLQVKDLVRLLTADGRRLPVLLFSEPLADFVDRLSAAATGLAHLVYLPAQQTFGLSDELPSFRAFNGTMRVYRPGLRVNDPPARHPRWYPENLDARAPVAILRSICAMQAPSSAALDLYSIAERAAGVAQASYFDELKQLRRDYNRTREENERLRADVAVLTELLAESERERERATPVTIVPLPDQRRLSLPPYSEASRLVRYLDDRYPERFLVTPRALRSYAGGAYADRRLLTHALDLLGTDYFAEIHGLPGARERFERRLHELHLRIGSSIRVGDRGKHARQYEIQVEGRTLRLDRHLRNEGNSRSPERCLAIYFTYDDVLDRIVLGSLPGHLENRYT